MELKEIRFSFTQVECLADALMTPPQPDIPYSFLLDSGKFKNRVAELKGSGGCSQLPSRCGYGRRFWHIYGGEKSPGSEEHWKSLLPLMFEASPSVSANWLQRIGSARAYGYLYPWGIGTVVDIAIRKTMSMDSAVELVVRARTSEQLEVNFGDRKIFKPIPVVMGDLCRHARAKAFGSTCKEGKRSEIFLVVTVTDAEGGTTRDPVAQDSPLYRQLYGWAKGNARWRMTELPPITESKTPTRRASPGNFLCAARNGRAVWCPDSFKSVSPTFKNSLRCYHQNLTVATLQTESLGMFMKHAAREVSAGTGHRAWPVNYDKCARLAAGILGRLNGGRTQDTYGSHSIQRQIKELYESDINVVREEYKMGLLVF